VARLPRSVGRGDGIELGIDGDRSVQTSWHAVSEVDPEMLLLKQRYAAEFTDAFKAVLVTLSSDERNVLRLHYLDGLTVEEVAQTLGKTAAAVKALQRRGLSTLRIALEKEGATL